MPQLPETSCVGSQLGVGSVHHTCPYDNLFQPACQCVTRAILSQLFYLIGTHQRQGSLLLALSSSHQGYAALILHQQLLLSSCMFFLTAPSSVPPLRPATPHCSPDHRAPNPQDPQLPQPGWPPAPAVLCLRLDQESSQTPHCPRELAWTSSRILPAA